jgi:trehalose 6-phosphate phosphatase
MMDILLLSRRNLLVQWARADVLLAFDFDGTLAPISAQRHAAAMRARTSALLSRACALFPCAVISGRSLTDLSARLPRHPSLRLVGNHGIEPSERQDECARWVAHSTPILRAALAGVAGVEVENKLYSISVHYRFAASRKTVMRALERALLMLNPAPRVVGGKLVINLFPPGAGDKGTALAQVMHEARVSRAIYVGDDDTDEDVFEREWPDDDLLGNVVTIRVGRSRSSAATYFIRGQERIDDLLRVLVDARLLLEAGSPATRSPFP